VAVCWLFGRLCVAQSPGSALAAIEATPVDSTRMLVAGGMALVSVVPVLAHVHLLPMSTKASNVNQWNCMGFVGRWAFLTRWTIALQCVYCVFSFYAEWSGSAAARQLIYCSCVLVASLGLFVTVQVCATRCTLHVAQYTSSYPPPRGLYISLPS
jgi:hypothetical protein